MTLDMLKRIIEDHLALSNIEVIHFTPSVVSSRRFIGVKTSDEKEFLIQIDEV